MCRTEGAAKLGNLSHLHIEKGRGQEEQPGVYAMPEHSTHQTLAVPTLALFHMHGPRPPGIQVISAP